MLDAGEVGPGWRPVLDEFLLSPEGEALQRFLDERKEAGAEIFPPRPFRALELTPLESVKVVIVGQDPYHGKGQAQGLAFSVADGVREPPSLRNIFKEVALEFGCGIPVCGDLSDWAKQGVLLINSVLTVEEGRPGSHAGKGWETLTDLLIGKVLEGPPKAFLLWGAQAGRKAEVVRLRSPESLVLLANHPSPLSAMRPPRPFIGCGHFLSANRWLEERGLKPISWIGDHK